MNDNPAVQIQNVDKETHDNIMRLNQKLKGLQVEIEAKMDAMALEPATPEAEEKRKRMQTLADEVKKAIDAIKTLVSMTTGPEQYGFKDDDLHSFSEMLKDSVDQLSRIRENF
ncbi:hypothetical protein [Legionella erythra]|uniref:Coiled-coil protein n=1 Tax=Legionella erythra TaxID=448 RepID=A0A0W0TQC7_LEGER|nr:hypothetical protein [Legionella erythra]KTC97793.1 hypothetical protein Lery_1632 [Legionella erythra]